MTRRVDAIFENGVLRPLEQLDGIAEHTRVKLSIDTSDNAGSPLADCVGLMSDEDAADMLGIIDAEFESVNLDEWK